MSGEPHGQRRLVGYSPWGHKELDIIDLTLSLLFSWHLIHSKYSIYILVLFNSIDIEYLLCIIRTADDSIDTDTEPPDKGRIFKDKHKI